MHTRTQENKIKFNYFSVLLSVSDSSNFYELLSISIPVFKARIKFQMQAKCNFPSS